MSYTSVYKTALTRELLMSLRRGSEITNPLMFFVLVIALFPLGIGPEQKQLAQYAPGILWVVALLASLLAIDGLFQSDYQDGSLEQMIISPRPLFLIILAKVTSHWLMTGLPLTLISPLMALLLHLPSQGIPALMAGLAIGTAVLSLLGAIGAGLTVGLQRSGVLVSLLILPLYTPVLIFGSSAVQVSIEGLAYDRHLAVIGGFLCLAIALAPFAISLGVRISVEN